MLEFRNHSDYGFEIIDAPIEPYEISTDAQFFNILRFNELDLSFKIAGDEYRCSNFAPEVFEFFYDFIAKSSQGNSEIYRLLRESGSPLSFGDRAGEFTFRFFSYPQQSTVSVNFQRDELSEYLSAFVLWYHQAVSGIILNHAQVSKLSEKICEFGTALAAFQAVEN